MYLDLINIQSMPIDNCNYSEEGAKVTLKTIIVPSPSVKISEHAAAYNILHGTMSHTLHKCVINAYFKDTASVVQMYNASRRDKQ